VLTTGNRSVLLHIQVWPGSGARVTTPLVLQTVFLRTILTPAWLLRLLMNSDTSKRNEALPEMLP